MRGCARAIAPRRVCGCARVTIARACVRAYHRTEMCVCVCACVRVCVRARGWEWGRAQVVIIIEGTGRDTELENEQWLTRLQ